MVVTLASLEKSTLGGRGSALSSGPSWDNDGAASKAVGQMLLSRLLAFAAVGKRCVLFHGHRLLSILHPECWLLERVWASLVISGERPLALLILTRISLLFL